MPILKRADEVVIVLHSLFVTLTLSLHLGSKALLLVNRVIELGVCVCVLCTADNELKDGRSDEDRLLYAW